jgi:hypothetical protein
VAGYYSATQQHKRRQPRLRGLLALNLAAAAGGAIVFVNSVVIVRSLLGYGDREVAITLGAFGLGSMVAALSLPSGNGPDGTRRHDDALAETARRARGRSG